MARPNLLLITTDQHNAEIMGCAGNPVVQTPHLDRLAAEGVVFDAAYTPCPYCTPARTSIFTGLYGRHHGFMHNINLREDRPDPADWTGLPAETPTFPALLAEQGYATALFGKLHTEQAGGGRFGLQTVRLAEGKGQFVPYGSGPDDYRQYLRARGYPDAAWRTWEHPQYRAEGHVTSLLPVEDYIDTWTATEALAYLQEVETPFCAWVSFSGPHTPWDPPEPYASMYDPADIPLPVRREGELEEKHPRWVDRLAQTMPAIPPRSTDPDAPGGLDRAYGRLAESELRAMLAAYYGQISLIDAQVGRLMAFLDAAGLRETTVVLFTADHGDYLGNNWAFYKYGAPYDSLARVPFIARWPGVWAGGGRVDTPVSLIDVAPTFLDLVPGVDRPAMDGRSLAPLLAKDGRQDDGGLDRDEVFVETGQLAAVVTSAWVYIRWQDGFEELYDRQADPHNLYNLAASAASRAETDAVRADLGRRLDAFEGVR